MHKTFCAKLNFKLTTTLFYSVTFKMLDFALVIMFTCGFSEKCS